MLHHVLHFFDKLEDHIRISLSHKPIVYALVGGIGIVLFWKGVWETAELFPILYGPMSVFVGLTILMMTGLLVSVFIGDSIILSANRQEKKLAEKTEIEVRTEEYTIERLTAMLQALDAKISKLESKSSTRQSSKND